MPVYEVKGPDGATYEVNAPKGASEADVLAYAKAQFAAPQPATPPAAAAGMQTALMDAGAVGRGVVGAARGLKDVTDNIGQGALKLVDMGLDAVGQPSDFYERSQADRQAAGQRYEAARAAAGGQGLDAGRLVGNTAGTLPTMALGPLAGGAASGVALGDNQDAASLGRNAFWGALGSKVGDLGTKAISNVIAPKIADGVRTLLDEGVTPTIGQAFGGATKRLEDGLGSIPIVGDMVRSAQSYANDTFNRAAINRALKPVGDALPDGLMSGYDAIDYAQKKLSAAYDDVLPRLNIKADQPFVQGVSQLYGMAKSLPAQTAEAFDRVVKNDVMARFSRNGLLSGNAFKETEQKLGNAIREYGRSMDPDHRQLANGFRELLSEVRDLAGRTNPAEAGRIAKINEGYSNLMRVERAAASAGAENGVFSPAQLDRAVTMLDNTARRRATAAGRAQMQDLSTAGRQALPSKVPDSGTPYRSMLAFALGGGATGATVSPLAGAGLAAVPLVYSRAALEKAIPLVLRDRPAAAKQLADAIRRGAPLASTVGAGAAVRANARGAE